MQKEQRKIEPTTRIKASKPAGKTEPQPYAPEPSASLFETRKLLHDSTDHPPNQSCISVLVPLHTPAKMRPPRFADTTAPTTPAAPKNTHSRALLSLRPYRLFLSLNMYTQLQFIIVIVAAAAIDDMNNNNNNNNESRDARAKKVGIAKMLRLQRVGIAIPRVCGLW